MHPRAVLSPCAICPLVRWHCGPQDTGSGPGEAEITPEASSLWMRKAPRPLREHRGVSEARTAEPALQGWRAREQRRETESTLSVGVMVMKRFFVGIDISAKTVV